MKNIVLIGMPGSGKSTIGVVAAKALGYGFLDSDLLIQAQEGDILENLIEKHGIDGFLAIENQVNRDIVAKRTVIATGGSVCYCDEAMHALKENGVVIYIKQNYNSIRERVGSLHKRGVVIRKGTTLRELYDERTPLYEKYADVVADLTGCQSLKDSIDIVISSIKECKQLYE